MSKKTPIVTNHAREKLKSRGGLNKKSTDRIVNKAYTHGITHSQTKGRLKKWVYGLYFYNKTATNIRLYGDKAYIFKSDGVLATVLQIPSDLTKDLNKMIKEKK